MTDPNTPLSPASSSPANPDRPTRVDVAIVGAGPVGLALAALLDDHGVTSRVFERRAGLHRDPQAHVINTRTMEILRELGLERAVAAAAAPPMRLRWITWCESLAGTELGRISLQGNDSSGLVERLALSPTSMANLAQNLLEPLLLDRVQAGARSHVAFSSEVVSVVEGGDGAAVTVRGDRGRESVVEARYVVACDGAASRTRGGLGIGMEGPTSLQKFVSIYFEADLERWIGGRSGPLFWIAGAKVRGVILGFDLEKTWTLMVPYDDPHSPDDFPVEVARRLVAEAIGDSAAAFRITSIGNWNMSAQVAATYRSSRVFLAGDAAHRFPPSGGLGMNTGIQDVHNLAWKLAAVLQGRAGAGLLDSYETERRPVAIANCDQSVRNAMRMMEVDMVLGVSTLAPVDPAAVANPEPLRVDFGIDGDSPCATEKRRALHDVIQSQAEHFDFTGLDLGFRYDEGAVVGDASEAPPFDVRVYTPVARPGSRLPHVWLLRRGERLSTHDVARAGRFTLITGDGGGAWTDAARDLVLGSAIDLDIAVIAGPGGRPGACVDTRGAWTAVSGIGSGGALLVRPDGHVAWRSAAGADAGRAREVLAHVFASILDHAGRGAAR